ncbi:MAG: hypothetical protein OXP75_06795 [Rhodospirillales bacterium]|nr:hypothetical protein [Rhodospirillales bacterium]
MKWPWQWFERREAVGGYTDIVSRLIQSQAIGSVQQASATAAMEAASGALARAFSGAKVEGPADVVEAVTPSHLALIGRDLVRVGESCHVIRMMRGRLRLIPSSTWYLEGGSDPDSWLYTCTTYGPSGSTTWRVPRDSVVHVQWGVSAARPYTGIGPAQWASETARLNANAERSLADEAGGPVAQLVAVPPAGAAEGDGDGDTATDPSAMLRADIEKARGGAMLLETMMGAYGQGSALQPQKDWGANRLGPNPPAPLVSAAEASFERFLASCGMSPALFSNADGTAQREALRRWHMTCVLPLAGLVEHELSTKLEADVRLKFDSYAMDMVSRGQVVKALVGAEVPLDKALAAVMLDEG